jgi:hypothetical protein
MRGGGGVCVVRRRRTHISHSIYLRQNLYICVESSGGFKQNFGGLKLRHLLGLDD